MTTEQRKNRNESGITRMLEEMSVGQFFSLVQDGNVDALRHDSRTMRFRTVSEQNVYLRQAFAEVGLKPDEVSHVLTEVLSILDQLQDIDSSKSPQAQRAEKRKINIEAVRALQEVCEQFSIIDSEEQPGSEPSAEPMPATEGDFEMPDNPENLLFEDFRKGVDLLKSITDPADFETTPLYKALSERYRYVSDELENLGFVSATTEMQGEGDEAEEVIVGYQVSDLAAEKLAPEEIEFMQAFFNSYEELSNSLTDTVYQSDINYQRKAHEAWVSFFELSDAATSDLIPSLESQFKPNIIGAERFEDEPHVADWTDEAQVRALSEYYTKKADYFFLEGPDREALNQGINRGTVMDGLNARLYDHLRKTTEGEFNPSSIPGRILHFARAQEILIHLRDYETPRIEERIVNKMFNRGMTKVAHTDLREKLDSGESFEINEYTDIGAIYKHLRDLRKEVAVEGRKVGISTTDEASKTLAPEELQGVAEFRQSYTQLANYLNEKRNSESSFDKPGFTSGQVGYIRSLINKLNKQVEIVKADVAAKNMEVLSEAYDQVEVDQERAERSAVPVESMESTARRALQERLKNFFPGDLDMEAKTGEFYKKHKQGLFRTPQSIAETDIKKYMKSKEVGSMSSRFANGPTAAPGNRLVAFIREMETLSGLSYGAKSQSVEAYLLAATQAKIEHGYTKNQYEQRKKRTEDAAEEFKKIKVPKVGEAPVAAPATKSFMAGRWVGKQLDKIAFWR